MPTRIAKLAPAGPSVVINTQAAIADPPETKPEPEKQEERTPRWFFDEILSLPLQDWGRVWSMELHRQEPKIPGVPGAKGYLCMFSEPITLAAIQQRYGGGKFRLNLCKNGKWYKSHEFDIEGQPIYDMSRERPSSNSNGAGGSGNADFQKEFISVLREELQRSRESTQGQNGGSDKAVEMIVTASEKAMEIVKNQTPQVTSGVTQIREMISALREMGIIGGAAATAPKSLVEQVIELITHPMIGPKVLELFTPKDPLAQLTQLAATKDALQKLFGGEGGDDTPKDWKAMATKVVGDHLPEIIDALKQNASNTTDAARARAAEAEARARAAESLRTVQQQRPGQPQPPVPTPQTQAAPAPAPPSIHVDGGLRTVPRGSSAAPVNEPAPAVAEAVETPASQAAYDEAVKVQIVNMLRIGASGETIADFLSEVKPDIYEDLKKYTAATITAFFAQDPILKLAVEDTRWNEVIADARAYALEPEGEDEPVKVN